MDPTYLYLSKASSITFKEILVCLCTLSKYSLPGFSSKNAVTLPCILAHNSGSGSVPEGSSGSSYAEVVTLYPFVAFSSWAGGAEVGDCIAV
jgi:hypothetical protein